MSRHPSPTANAAVRQAALGDHEGRDHDDCPASPPRRSPADRGYRREIAAARKDTRVGQRGLGTTRQRAGLCRVRRCLGPRRSGRIALRRRNETPPRRPGAPRRRPNGANVIRLPPPSRTTPARRAQPCAGCRSSAHSTAADAPRSSGSSRPTNRSSSTSAALPSPAPGPGRRCSDPSARTETSLPHRYPAHRCTWLSGAAHGWRATTTTSWPDWVCNPCAPDSSPRPCVTRLTPNRSCAKPATSATAPCRDTPLPSLSPQRGHRPGLMTSPASGVDLDPTASHTWTLFADWCSATGHVALPAQPETLAEFLADHPARLGTHRRRVTAINSAHRQCGLSEPGRAHAVHAALATRQSPAVASRRRRPRRGNPATPGERLAARALRAA